MITPTAQICMKKDFGYGFSQAHRTCNKIFDLQYTKIKANMAKKKHQNSKVNSNFDLEHRKQSFRGVLKICSKFKEEHPC